MAERDQELAHTAGLLHDIGRFALSDRVMERGVVADRGRLARRSAATPSIGADLLRDIGVFGPLSARSSSPTTSGSTARATRAG